MKDRIGWNLSSEGLSISKKGGHIGQAKSLDVIRSENMRFMTVADLTGQGEKLYGDDHMHDEQNMKKYAESKGISSDEFILVLPKRLRGGGSNARSGSDGDSMECSGGSDGDSMECSGGSDGDSMECSGGSHVGSEDDRTGSNVEVVDDPMGLENKQQKDGAYDYFDEIFEYTPGQGEVKEIYRARLTGGACTVSAVQMVLRLREENFKDMDVAQALGYSWADGGAHIEKIPLCLERLKVSGAKHEVADNIKQLQAGLNKSSRPIIVGIGKPGFDSHAVIVNNIEDSYGDATFVCICDSNSDIGHYKVSIDEWMSAWNRNYVYFE